MAKEIPVFNDEWFAEQIKLGIKAPDFPQGLRWLNTGGKELHFKKELKGRIVIIDFWTYCCINCMHVLPDLPFLEEKYAGKPLVILGCHSAKFNNEQDIKNIRQAILRYNIRHPVVVDEHNKIWDAFTVNSWPTLVVVDPEGTILGGFAGEGHRDALDALISAALSYYGKRNLLAQEGLRLAPEDAAAVNSDLLFPGKVLADPEARRLYIADSNHNRIVATDLDGTWLFTIGSGKAGKRDGSFAEAEFDRPQGMALHNGVLYVADTENHLIRAAHLEKKTVQTVAGTGRQSREYFKSGKGIALSSPWDLAAVGNTLYIAMAGSHQLWTMDLESQIVSTYAGSGRESCTDGPRLQATFAQPSGLSFDGRYLYVADSEVSSIRRLDLKNDGRVETVAGSRDLFGFGLRDGKGSEALFQHPLGVFAHNGYVFVADTYNHTVRSIDSTGAVKTIIKGAAPDKGTARQVLYEPGGLAAYKDRLYIADSNNHRIQFLNLQSMELQTLTLKGLTPQQQNNIVEDIAGPRASRQEVPGVVLKPGTKGEIRILITLPPEHHLLEGFAAQYLVKVYPDAPVVIPENSRSGKVSDTRFYIPFTAGAKGRGTIEVQAVYGYCNDKDKLCIPREVIWKIDLSLEPQTGGEIIELEDKPQQ